MWKGLPLTFCDLTKCEIDFLGCVMIRYGLAANCKANDVDILVKIILAIASALLCYLSLHSTFTHTRYGIPSKNRAAVH